MKFQKKRYYILFSFLMVLLAYIMFENNRFKSDNTIMSYSNNFTDNQIDTIFENRFT
ncbi:MAG: hypothetical protein ACI94Y_004371, partial [Maribacter sp.]